MLERVHSLLKKIPELEVRVSQPEIMADQKKYKEVMQEYSFLKDLERCAEEYEQILKELAETKELLGDDSDPQMREMAEEELSGLKEQETVLENRLRLFLIPKDPLEGKNIIMEIRAGTGGDEAALFAADLFRAYSKYAEIQGWRTEILSENSNEIGGFKEIVFSIDGKGVYGTLRYESGGHRVQRIPTTDSGGRIHTSAVTVAVLPEAEETDLDIRDEDLKIDVFRSSGPGGQSVNTTDSAVRITHLPTGVVVSCQDEKSQIKNKAKAFRVLRARLLEAQEEKLQKERAEERKSQVGSGDRSQRIRTYNYPQSRVTDHRINLTLYKLAQIMEGELDEVINALKLSANEELLNALG